MSYPEEKFLEQLDKLHTTKLGEERIKRNLSLPSECDAVKFCTELIKSGGKITKRGKNIYISTDNAVITVNAGSLTIITAHNKSEI